MKEEEAKEALDKLVLRLYYDLNYYKIINKIGVSNSFVSQFKTYLKKQINDFLSSKYYSEEHKKVLKDKVKEYSSQSIFIETGGAFAKYLFNFKNENTYFTYELKANDILIEEQPDCKINKFNSINFLVRYILDKLLTNEALIYTYNFTTSNVDTLKSKIKKEKYRVYNKKMSWQLNNGEMLCFDDL